MSSMRGFALPQTNALASDAQRRAEGQALTLALVLLLTVLIVEAVAIGTAIPAVPDIGWLYASTR